MERTTTMSCVYELNRLYITEDKETKKKLSLLTSPQVTGIHMKSHGVAKATVDKLLAACEKNTLSEDLVGGHYTEEEHTHICDKLITLYAERTSTKPDVNESEELKFGHIRDPLVDSLPSAMQKYEAMDERNVHLIHVLVSWYLQYAPKPTLAQALGMLCAGMCRVECMDAKGAVLPYEQQHQTISECYVPIVDMPTLLHLAVRFAANRVNEGHASVKHFLPMFDVETIDGGDRSHIRHNQHMQPFKFHSAADYFFWLVVRHLGAQHDSVVYNFPDTPKQLATWFMPAPIDVARLLDIKELMLPDFICCSGERFADITCKVAYPRRAYHLIAKAANDVLAEIFLQQLLLSPAKVYLPVLTEFIPLKLALHIAQAVWKADGQTDDHELVKSALHAITNLPICMDEMHTETPEMDDRWFTENSTAYQFHALVTDNVGFSAMNNPCWYFFLYHQKVGLKTSPAAMAALVSRHTDDPKFAPSCSDFEKHSRGNLFRFDEISAS